MSSNLNNHLDEDLGVVIEDDTKAKKVKRYKGTTSQR